MLLRSLSPAEVDAGVILCRGIGVGSFAGFEEFDEEPEESDCGDEEDVKQGEGGGHWGKILPETTNSTYAHHSLKAARWRHGLCGDIRHARQKRRVSNSFGPSTASNILSDVSVHGSVRLSTSPESRINC